MAAASALLVSRRRTRYAVIFVLALNFMFWQGTKVMYPRWDGVPPVPTMNGALASGLGDHEFAYRFFAISLQNFGNVGRDFSPLKNYDYGRLGQWFDLLDTLDPLSDHVPQLASNYFGASRVPAHAAVVAKYLGRVGNTPYKNKWRHLAQAAYLAQHRMNDMDLALHYAEQLQKLNAEGKPMPQWARQMAVFVYRARGEKDKARALMEKFLVTDPTDVPEEINFMKLYLTEELGVPRAEVEQLARMRPR